MKKQLLILFAACSLFLTSCDSGGSSDYVTTQEIVSCFATMQNPSDASTYVAGNMRYTMELNYTQGTINLTVYNLSLPDGTKLPTMMLRDLKATSDEKGWIKASAPIVIPQTNGAPTNHTIDNFQFQLLQRAIEGRYAPALIITFTLDGKYSVFSSISTQIFGGTTTSTGAGDPFQSKQTLYAIIYNTEKKTVDLSLRYAQFASQMPKMTFDLADIPANMHPGMLSFSIDNVIPTINKTPQESFPITDLSGNITYSTGFDLTFKCTPGVPHFGGATFRCSASGTYFDFPTAE